MDAERLRLAVKFMARDCSALMEQGLSLEVELAICQQQVAARDEEISALKTELAAIRAIQADAVTTEATDDSVPA